MRRLNKGLENCRIRSEVTLRVEGGIVTPEDWRLILGV